MEVCRLLLVLGMVGLGEGSGRGGGLKELYKRWESRRVRVQGAGRKEVRERARAREEELLLGLGETRVDGGKPIQVFEEETVGCFEKTAKTIKQEGSLKEVESEEQSQNKELKQTDGDLEEEEEVATVTYIVSGADRTTVVAKLTTDEEKENYFTERALRQSSSTATPSTVPPSTLPIQTTPQGLQSSRRPRRGKFPILARWTARGRPTVAPVLPGLPRVARRMLEVTTVSPEEWLDRFYSKNIQPKKHKSSSVSSTSVTSSSSSKPMLSPASSLRSQQTHNTLRGLVALVSSESARLKPDSAKTSKLDTARKNAHFPVSSTAPPVVSPSAGSTSPPPVVLITTKEPGRAKAVKPKDFLLQMMLLSQDTNTLTTASTSTTTSPPPIQGETEILSILHLSDSSNLPLFSSNTDKWQAVSELREAPEGHQDGFSKEFGDSLALTAGLPAQSPLPISNTDKWQVVSGLREVPEGHQDGRGGFREEFGDSLVLTAGLAAQTVPIRQPANHQAARHGELHGEHGQGLHPVNSDFQPNIKTSDYGTQWLPVFSPSTRMSHR